MYSCYNPIIKNSVYHLLAVYLLFFNILFNKEYRMRLHQMMDARGEDEIEEYYR